MVLSPRRDAAFRPDVVLCDIGLPGIDVYAVARAIRSDPDLQRVSLIAPTGHGMSEDVAGAREGGFDGHLTKPPTVEAIEAALALSAAPHQPSPAD